MTSERRRLDRVLAPDYTDGLDGLSLEEVRKRRHDAEQEEADLSYIRRLLHGRMDIVRAEQARRRDGSGEDDTVVEHLNEILADSSPQAHGMGRFLTVEPSRVAERRRSVERLVSDVATSDVRTLDDAHLDDALVELQAHERKISSTRHRVQQVMDACAADIARRYKEGSARVEDLLTGESG
jgi:hypothetical protein